jgi:hypothetical protein
VNPVADVQPSSAHFFLGNDWYFLKVIGWALLALVAIALWAVPNPVGKVVEFWNFFRGK